jgi:undecaprenyl pyrophosphate phosphatase UppP
MILAAFVVVFANMLIRTDRNIAELKERKGENVKRYSGRQISMLIPAGFLINSIALLGVDHIPTAIRGVMLVIAVSLIIAGAVVTAIRRKR